MMQVQLKASFEPADRARIEMVGGSILILTRAITDYGKPERYMVWQSFVPSVSNKMGWTDVFEGYASNAPIRTGSVISPEILGGFWMQTGYRFDLADGVLTETEDPSVSEFRFVNGSSEGKTFGLRQEMEINGRPIASPSSAIYCGPGKSEDIRLLPTVYMAVGQSLARGTVLDRLPNNKTQIDIPPGSLELELRYDWQTSRFVPTSI